MSSNHPVYDEAFQIAAGARERQSRAEKDKRDLEARIRQLELETVEHKAAADRLLTFSLHRDGVLQYPRCWIVQEIAADLTPIAGDDRNEKFRCTHCRYEISTPF